MTTDIAKTISFYVFLIYVKRIMLKDNVKILL